MSDSKNPAFNLKVVLQETNIAADTLRSWERRYGLPIPQRTAGGHRLYSQYDIETIKWLLARQADGLSISRAVDLWNEHYAAGVDPLAGFPLSTFSPDQAALANYISPDSNLDSLRAQWIEACLNFSETTVEQVLNRAFSIYPVEAVCTDVLQKGMAEIGGLWYENKATVQQEHFASCLAMRRLDALLSASPAPTRDQTILVGCPPNEWHTFTPLLLSLLLRRRGLNVIYLGANVPAEQFEETVSTVHASLIILAAQTLISAAALQMTALILTDLKTPIGFGGRVFNIHPNLANHVPGNHLGGSIAAALDKVEKLLKSKNAHNNFTAVSKEYLAAQQTFMSRRIHIESTLKELTQPDEDFNGGIQLFGDNITAALQLGDMNHVTKELEWLKTLMQSHQRPMQELTNFMKKYSRAVDKHISNKEGAPLKAWLNAQATQG